MDDPSGGVFRWWPQETLEDIAGLVNPILDVLLLVIPYLFLLLILASPLFVFLWLRMEKVKGPLLNQDEERTLRTVPLSFGLWGWFAMHVLIMTSARLTQAMTSSVYARNILEIVMMALAFFTMFGLLNIMVRAGLDKKLRKKFNLLDKAIIAQLLMALGVGLYTWATVRHASVWSVTVVLQHFLESWTFRQGAEPAIFGMPTMAKLHVVVGSLAIGTMLQSRMICLLMIPRPSLWRLDLLLGKDADVDAGRAMALMYGISADEKHGHGKKEEKE